MEEKKSLFSNVGKDAIESLMRHENNPDDAPKRYVVEFGLKGLLKARGIKQKELAAMAGLRPNAVTNICRGYPERVSLDHIGKIATALGITDISEIMYLVEENDSDWFNMYNSLHPDDEDDE